MPAITLSKTTWTKIVNRSTKRIDLYIHNVDATAANRIYVSHEPRPTGGTPAFELGEGGKILFGTDELRLNAKDNPKARGPWWAFSPLANASTTLIVIESAGMIVSGRRIAAPPSPSPSPPSGNGVGFPGHYPV